MNNCCDNAAVFFHFHIKRFTSFLLSESILQYDSAMKSFHKWYNVSRDATTVECCYWFIVKKSTSYCLGSCLDCCFTMIVFSGYELPGPKGAVTALFATRNEDINHGLINPSFWKGTMKKTLSGSTIDLIQMKTVLGRQWMYANLIEQR